MMQFYNAKRFIEKIFELQKSGYSLFRGSTDAKFPLAPKAFREDKINELSDGFPHPIETVKKWFAKAIKNIRENPNKVLASATTDYFLNQLCQLLITNLRYNYGLYKKYHLEGFPQNCNDEKLIHIFKLGEEWSREEIFLNYVERFYMLLISFVSANGKKLIKKPFVMKDVTGLDESYPQHYDMPTAALDWTYDPLIALFFTIYSDDSSSDFKFLSFFAYREINTQGSPILIKGKDNFKDNKRAIAQKGTFSYFQHPCSFFLNNGRFPAIEDYQHSYDNKVNNYFEIEKIVLLRSKENIMHILKTLAESRINKELLYLE